MSEKIRSYIAFLRWFFGRVVKRAPGKIFTFSIFFVLLIIYILKAVMAVATRIPGISHIARRVEPILGTRITRQTERMVGWIESRRPSEVKRSYIIHLAMRNLAQKKTRSMITILGMSVGVGSIVLLLSIGFGVERLIIRKVAGLNELKLLDVTTGTNTSLHITTDTVATIKKFGEVEKISPVISLVGKVSVNKATTDVLVYGSPKDYIDFSKTKLLRGDLFSDNSLYERLPSGDVAGAEIERKSARIGSVVDSVRFTIPPDQSVHAYANCSTDSEISGLVRHTEGGYAGERRWGSSYAPFQPYGRAGYDERRGVYSGLWIRAYMPMFSTVGDPPEAIPASGSGQLWQEVCVPQSHAVVLDAPQWGSVLGESSASADLADSTEASDAADTTVYEVVEASGSGGMEMVSLVASTSAEAKKEEEFLAFTAPPSLQAVVSKGLLDLLGLSPDAVGKEKIGLSFIITNAHDPDIKGKRMSEQVEYSIVGVLDDADSSYLYVPITDLQKVGVIQFSQLKVLFKNQSSLTRARHDIESLGFRTASTLDTVKRIESLFVNVRIVLALLGIVALGVASLGMFNTLTVSLMERTREIGGMKTIGMVSQEVEDLFLAEAMIMGLAGGVGGLTLGWIVGKLISLLLTFVAVFRGQGFIDVTYIPPYFVVFILMSSFVVGILTGLYPAYRAKKISALNALRYE